MMWVGTSGAGGHGGRPCKILLCADSSIQSYVGLVAMALVFSRLSPSVL